MLGGRRFRPISRVEYVNTYKQHTKFDQILLIILACTHKRVLLALETVQLPPSPYFDNFIYVVNGFPTLISYIPGEWDVWDSSDSEYEGDVSQVSQFKPFIILNSRYKFVFNYLNTCYFGFLVLISI